MIRVLNFFCVAVRGLSILALYDVSEHTRLADVGVARTAHEIAKEHDRISALEAEWEFTARPERVATLAQSNSASTTPPASSSPRSSNCRATARTRISASLRCATPMPRRRRSDMKRMPPSSKGVSSSARFCASPLSRWWWSGWSTSRCSTARRAIRRRHGRVLAHRSRRPQRRDPGARSSRAGPLTPSRTRFFRDTKEAAHDLSAATGANERAWPDVLGRQETLCLRRARADGPTSTTA